MCGSVCESVSVSVRVCVCVSVLRDAAYQRFPKIRDASGLNLMRAQLRTRTSCLAIALLPFVVSVPRLLARSLSSLFCHRLNAWLVRSLPPEHGDFNLLTTQPFEIIQYIRRICEPFARPYRASSIHRVECSQTELNLTKSMVDNTAIIALRYVNDICKWLICLNNVCSHPSLR